MTLFEVQPTTNLTSKTTNYFLLQLTLKNNSTVTTNHDQKQLLWLQHLINQTNNI